MSKEDNDNYWHLDDYKPLIDELPEICDDDQKIKDIFSNIPIRLPVELIDSIMRLIIKQTNRGKRKLNEIYKEQFKINYINQLQEEPGDFEYIKYDKDWIQIGKDDIHLLQIQGKFIKTLLIAEFSLKILYKAIDKIKNGIDRYTFISNRVEFYSYEVNEFLKIYRDKMFKGNLGQDVIRKIFAEKSKTILTRIAEEIMGWNNGWHIPINDKENDFMLICHTMTQRDNLDRVRKAHKKYSPEEKIQLCQMLNKFIAISKFDPYCLTITAAWSITSLFKPYFIKYFKIFPHLGMEGDRSTGKSAIMDVFINYLWRIYDEHVPGNSLNSLPLVGQLVTAGTFPIYIDELEVSSKTFVSMLKEMANAMSYHIKLNPDGSIREKIPTVASIAMSSNTGYLKAQFGDLANNSKAIILNPKIITSKDDRWIRMALKIKEEKYFSLVYEYTKDWTDKDLDKLVGETEKEFNIDEKIKELGDDEFVTKNYPRLKENYTIILMGVLLWKKIFGIKLKTDDKILNILIESRGYILSELVNYFLLFCKEAKEYSYNEINSEGKTIPKNHPRYLNHELKVNNKGWGLFDTNNLEDFKQKSKIDFKGLPDLCNQVIEGLNPENKDWLFIHKTSYKGQDIYCIKVSPEILDYSIWDHEEPWKDITEDQEEDTSIELDFDELGEDMELELLDVDGIEEKD